MIEVSVIIVSYNTKELLHNCLISIYEYTKELNFEVIVSDNGSNDGSIDMIKTIFPQVILIENNENLGFGAANNRGLKIAKGKYILYLNSDTLLLNNAIKYFFDYWELYGSNEKLGAIGCHLVDENNIEIHSGAKFPDYKSICHENIGLIKSHVKRSLVKFFHLEFLYRFKKNKKNSNYNNDAIEYVTGADLFMLNNIEAHFDERYTLYYEETDMQLQLFKKGYKMKLIETPKIVHLVHKNIQNKNITSFSILQCQRSGLLYTQKNLLKKGWILKLIIKLDWLNPYVRMVRKKLNIDLK